MNQLAERKRSLILQGALQRELIVLEYLQARGRYQTFRETVVGKRWWWIVGAAVGGWLITRPASGIASWVPLALNVLRAFRSKSR